MKYLGIDLGGTNVAAAVVDSEGTILGKVSLPTPRGAEAVADQMAAAARGAAEAAGTALDEVVSVGIGAPGAIEPDTGVIKYWSNLDFTNVPITALMKARLDKEILLENDANAAALGDADGHLCTGLSSIAVDLVIRKHTCCTDCQYQQQQHDQQDLQRTAFFLFLVFLCHIHVPFNPSSGACSSPKHQKVLLQNG